MHDEKHGNRVSKKVRSSGFGGRRYMRRYSSIRNGKRGGRPKGISDIKLEIPDIELVILTRIQYDTLLHKYGLNLLNKALSILEYWLKNSPDAEKYRGKNNYAHFRSDGWVINTAKEY